LNCHHIMRQLLLKSNHLLLVYFLLNTAVENEVYELIIHGRPKVSKFLFLFFYRRYQDVVFHTLFSTAVLSKK